MSYFKYIVFMFLSLLFTTSSFADSAILNRDDIFKKESSIIDYYNANNKAINFYLFGNDYSNFSMEEIEQNKERLDKIIDSNWVKTWIVDKQISDAELDNIYTYVNTMLNELATNKLNAHNAIAVNPLRINEEEDKAGINNYWFNIIMIPKDLFENKECVGTVLVFAPNACSIIPERWNELINDYLSQDIGVQINSDFVWSFIATHEIAHSLPYQLNLKIFMDRENEFNVDPKKYKNIDSYYKEVYSDLYASIKMMQNGYSKDNLKTINYMRTIALFLDDDINHYTPPYIELLLNEPSINYLNLKSLDEINNYINNLFIKGFNAGNYPDIELFDKTIVDIKPNVRKLNSFLLNLLSATSESSNPKLKEFIKAFNTRVYFSNARLRVRMKNY